jgi:hypothetical protein
MIAAAQLRSCGKLAPTRPPSTFPQPPQLRRRANVLTMSLDDSVSYLPGTYGPMSDDDEDRVPLPGGRRIWYLATGREGVQ